MPKKGQRASGDTLGADVEAGPAGTVPEDQQTSAQAYPNYYTGWSTAVPLAITVFLFALWAVPPTKSTGIIAAGTEFVGAVARCTGTVCEDWLRGGASGGTGGTSPTAVPEAGPTPDVPTPAPAAAIRKRAESLAGVDPTKFFTSTGVAVLAAFYISLYITIFFIIRCLSPPDPPRPPSTTDDEAEEPRGELWRETRVFAYRASRCLGVVLVVLLLGCLGASGKAIMDVRKEMKLVGSDGIGGGLFLLLFGLFFSFYSCLRDLANPSGKIRHWLGFRCCCPNNILCISRKPLPKEELPMTALPSRVSDPPSYVRDPAEPSRRGFTPPTPPKLRLETKPNRSGTDPAIGRNRGHKI